MKRSRDGKHCIPTVRAKCGVMIPQMGALPTRCEGRAFKGGKCVEHHTDSRNASDARRIEAHEFRTAQLMAGKTTKRGRVALPVATRLNVAAKPYIPKADRKRTKNPVRVRPETRAVA